MSAPCRGCPRADRGGGGVDLVAAGRPGEIPPAARLRRDLGGGHPAGRLPAERPGAGFPHRLGAAGGDLAAPGVRHGDSRSRCWCSPSGGCTAGPSTGACSPAPRSGWPTGPRRWRSTPSPRPSPGARPGTGTHALTWTVAVAAAEIVGWLVHNSLIVSAVKLSDPSARLRDIALNREALLGDFAQMDLGILITVVVAVHPVLAVLAVPTVLLARRFMMHASCSPSPGSTPRPACSTCPPGRARPNGRSPGRSGPAARCASPCWISTTSSGQRHLRPPGRGQGAAGGHRRPARAVAQLRPGRPVRRRGVRDPAAADAGGPGAAHRRTAPHAHRRMSVPVGEDATAGRLHPADRLGRGGRARPASAPSSPT